MSRQLFDDWPEQYNRWFETPIGALVKHYEEKLVLDLLQPRSNELILDVGCGTGLFTRSVIAHGSVIVGLDVSEPMLRSARRGLSTTRFWPVLADMLVLPFADDRFDKTLSITALEFVKDAGSAIDELFRVTRPKGRVVIATLNSLSPWAKRRRAEASRKDKSVFEHAFFRSPDQLRKLIPVEGMVKTAVHFEKDADPARAGAIEHAGQQAGSDAGAFLIGCWQKP